MSVTMVTRWGNRWCGRGDIDMKGGTRLDLLQPTSPCDCLHQAHLIIE